MTQSQEEPDIWSYSTGRRGVSRVRVYERYPGGPIQVEYTGGKRQTLTNLADVPVTDRTLATAIANRLSDKLAAGAKRHVAREALGLPEARTLKELLDRYHKDKAAEWGEKHASTQKAMRTWWESRLGPSTEIRQINEGAVEREIRLATDARSWAPRTRQKYLRYIMAVFRFARRKLKWIREQDDLTAVDVPKPEPGGPSYTHAEMVRMLEAAPKVDRRVSAALAIAYATQARSKAVLHLRPEDYTPDGRLRFDKAFDKAKRSRVAVLPAFARERVEALLETRPGPWLFMEGAERLRYDRLLEMLEAVETKAKVPKVKRRGWHGVKRRAVTDALHASKDRKAVSQQAGTTEATLERVYEQDDMGPKQALADAMERLIRGA